jgi:hypothetical protein
MNIEMEELRQKKSAARRMTARDVMDAPTPGMVVADEQDARLPVDARGSVKSTAP